MCSHFHAVVMGLYQCLLSVIPPASPAFRGGAVVVDSPATAEAESEAAAPGAASV